MRSEISCPMACLCSPCWSCSVNIEFNLSPGSTGSPRHSGTLPLLTPAGGNVHLYPFAFQPLVHVCAKNLVAFVSQEAGNKPVLLAMALKDKTMEGIQALREVIRSCQVWWSCAIWIQGNDLESVTHHHLFKRTRNENDGMSLWWFWTSWGISWIFLYCVEHLWVLLLGQVCKSIKTVRWEQLSQHGREVLLLSCWVGHIFGKGLCTAHVSWGAADAKLCSCALPQRGNTQCRGNKKNIVKSILPVFFFFLLCENHFNWNTSLGKKKINTCIMGKIFLPF